MKYNMRAKYLLLSYLFLLFFFQGNSNLQAYEPTTPVDLEDVAFYERVVAGEELFKANCSSCHAVSRALTGPALNQVWERWESEENIIAWIKNSTTYLATGDPYAVELYNKWNQTAMTAFPQLTDDQVLGMMDYVRSYDAYMASKKSEGETTGDDTAAAPAGPSKTIMWIMLGFLGALFLILGIVTNKLTKLTQERKGIEVAEPTPLVNLILSKRVIGTVVVIVVLFAGYSVVTGAVNLGRSQGYQPDQPINFSHVVHAGQNQIDCQYCHSGVEKSKHAYIPSVTVCMNCHKYVQEGPKTGTTEIAKIYEASGWDVDQQQYTNPAKPVEWVKVHNLPDHVYFNHSQHVKVGGLDCQTCHGNVEEMEVVQQFAPLSMGWCVNCHRETKVNFRGNEYYETTFERFHNELKMQERSRVTVEEIGGTECQKCHY